MSEHAFDEQLSAILGRRSIRSYEATPIEDDRVKAVLRAAMAAPSACAADPWRFVVVREPGTLQRLAEGLPNGTMLGSATAGIVVCGDQEAAHDKQISYLLQDCSAAIENLLLAAHMLGVGACWLGVHPRMERVAHVAKTLSIPEPVLPIACLALGYPAKRKEPRTRYKEENVHHEKW
jgi:nitroreductase